MIGPLRRLLPRWELLAIAATILSGLVVGAYILSNQRLKFPWEDTYAISAELSTAQAVAPGQGQIVAVAGVQVGEVGEVRLRDGRALVRMDIDAGKLPAVHADATVLVRPKTGLQDMALQLDPGSSKARELEEGDVIPVSRTRPNVNMDEVLAALDADARDYLRILLSASADGLDDQGVRLRKLLSAGAPTLKQTQRVTEALAGRDEELRRLVSSLRKLAGTAAEHDDQIAALVDAGDATLRTVADHDRTLRATLRALPGTLSAARAALDEATPFARALEPALRELGPAAGRLTKALPKVDPLLRDAKPAVTRIRGLTKEAIPLAQRLDPAVGDLRAVTPALIRSFDVLTRVVDQLGHNPPGEEEGYLYWLTWFLHNGASVFSVDDAQGAVWRGALMVSCSSIAGFEEASQALAAVTALPICPDDPTAKGGTR